MRLDALSTTCDDIMSSVFERFCVAGGDRATSPLSPSRGVVGIDVMPTEDQLFYGSSCVIQNFDTRPIGKRRKRNAASNDF